MKEIPQVSNTLLSSWLRSTVLCSLVFLTALSCTAQDSLYLNLSKVIEMTKSDNLSVKKQLLQSALAEGAYQHSKEWWLPDLFVGTSIHHMHGSGLNTDGRIFVDVDRQSRWYGAGLNLDWDIGKGIYESKSKKLALQQTAVQSQLAQNETILEAVLAYYQVLMASTKKAIYAELINRKEDLSQQLDAQVKVGLRLESELLMARSNSSRLKLKLIQTDNEYQLASNKLLHYLNLKEEFWVQVDPNDLNLVELVNLNDLINADISQHPLMEVIKLQGASLALESKAIKNSLLIPDLDLYYDHGPFGRTYNDNQMTRNLQASIGWNLPLGQLIYGGERKMVNARAQINNIEQAEQSSQLQTKFAAYSRQLLNAENMLTIAQEGSKYAQKAFEQAVLRQEKGIGNAYEILLSQEEFIKARLMYYESLIQYNIKQFQLYEILGNQL